LLGKRSWLENGSKWAIESSVTLNVLLTNAEMLVELEATMDANPDDLEMPNPVTFRVHVEKPAVTLYQ